uniref:SKP1 component POZ domain-containing protein n=1 Tax=Panagrolaimus sp. JU765 TaxID=591449 RepID=A0AC34QR10_9BILA
MERSNKIRIITLDDATFDVEVDLLCHSLQLRKILENHSGIDEEFNVMEDAEPIRFRKTRSDVLRPIIEWLQNHKDDAISSSRNNRIVPDGVYIDDEHLNASFGDDEVQIMKWNGETTVVEDPKLSSLKHAVTQFKKSAFELYNLDANLPDNNPLGELLSKAKGLRASFGLERPLDNAEVSEMNDFCPPPSRSETFQLLHNLPDSSSEPLLSQSDIAFFKKIPKDILLQIIKTSRNMQLHELNRCASIFAAMNMGNTRESIEDYFNIHP